MKRTMGLLLAGGVAVLLLEPSGGARRRARVKEWLGPVQGRIGKLRGRAQQPDEAPDEQQSILDSVQHVAQSLQAPFETANGAVDRPPATGTTRQSTTGSAQGATAGSKGTVPAAPEATRLAPTAGIDPIPEGEPNDPTLVSRVESELFRDATLPKGELNIDAANGVVTLRGTVTNDAQARDIVERTGAIEGVDKVVDLLHRG